jgi:4-hydroxy-tetrahydrodipicolinate synthase
VGLVLLPPPHFFPYGQGDLVSFCREVAGKVEGRILLYNLPQFTSGFAPETTLELVLSIANIVGIKDSSGSLETLRLLTDQVAEACRIVGNDEALVEAVKQGCCDAVISGVACAVPELIRDLWTSAVSGDAERLATKEAVLAEFIQRIHDVPTPWGLKWVAEIRGIAQARFPMRPSAERSQHGRELQQWFRSWWTGSPVEWAPKQDEVVTGQ